MNDDLSHIELRGVRQNNLKSIDVSIPLGKMTVICGPSGSGKSSLAFETLYAEGQRRFIESMSNYARQFLNKAPQPDLDSISNIPPAIAVEQKNHVKTSRSTVGTTTEVIDYLRLLYEKIGKPVCPNHQTPIESESVTKATDKILRLLTDKRGYILAPVLHDGRIAKGKKLLQLLLKEGYLRLMVSGKQVDLTPKTSLPEEDFEIIIDRTAFRTEDRGRVVDSVAQAYSASQKLNANLTGGRARILTTDNEELRVSEENACSLCGFTFPQISSRLFSFSSPVGACQSCNGFGNILTLDEKKVVPNDSLSIAQGAIQPFAMPSAESDKRELLTFCKKAKIDIHAPWKDLPRRQTQLIWEGTKEFYGIKGLFEYLEGKKYKMHVRVFISRFKSAVECHSCHGTRLRKEVHHILVDGKSIVQLSALPVSDFLKTLKTLKLSKMESDISGEILSQLLARTQFLFDVGVGYLTLDRQTRTLSGGEYQRLNLANQLGMGLSQTLYVLDEPTVGLHPRDNHRLIDILKKLKDLGNTLVVVEHDKDVIRSAENILELGPGSGHLGGDIIFDGPAKDFFKSKDSKTAHHLALDEKWVPMRTVRPVNPANYKYMLQISGCTGHNLKNVDLGIPLNRLVVVTGVSGSGKSTLISQTLYPAIEQILTGEHQGALPYQSLRGIEHIKQVILIDQKAIGKSSRSNPVTYMKVYDEIREIMASTEEAKSRGYTSRFFSLNVDAGRCPKCNGEGHETIDMMFMDDITLVCEECNGKRFKPEILEIHYRGKNIDDILNMTVLQAMDFFVSYPSIRRPLSILKEVGLDYLRVGQSARTLSGGESQRLKIAKEFNSINQKATLYILDEPTTGLHPHEIDLLMIVLNKLIEAGGSVILIEHNLDVIRNADYLIELGPEGGAGGGELLFFGTPEEMAKSNNCPTAEFLRPYLQP